jgi:hypothetical protein
MHRLDSSGMQSTVLGNFNCSVANRNNSKCSSSSCNSASISLAYSQAFSRARWLFEAPLAILEHHAHLIALLGWSRSRAAHHKLQEQQRVGRGHGARHLELQLVPQLRDAPATAVDTKNDTATCTQKERTIRLARPCISSL